MLMLAIIVSGSVFAQNGQKDLEQMMKNRGEYYFSLTVDQPTEIQVINELCSVDKTDGIHVICYANQRQYDNLIKQGYRPTLMTPPSMQEERYAMWDGSNRAAYDWDQYPTYEAYEAMMQQFATDHPDRCTYIELGTLSSGRKLMVCRINNGETDGKVKFLYTSTMHGDEVTGMMLMLRLIDELCTSNDARIMNLVNNLDIFISPCTNPDGTYHGGNSTVYGATRYNGNNVDLNRHYPDFDKGPHPDGASHYEDETQWLMDLAQEYLFTMSANYHGGAEVMNYPWDTYQPIHPDDAWWQMVCREYADLAHQQSSSYMTDLNNGITNGYAWYTISGSRQDYMNYYAQCREVTIECSGSKTPNASQMPTFWNYNYNSMLAYMEQSLNGITGTVTDATTGQPIVATVTISGHDHHGSSVTSHLPMGDYHRVIKGGTYEVTYTANGYYPQTYTITVADGESVTQDVQLEAGEGIIPDFTANSTDVALGGSVDFTDDTWGANLVSWQWTFEGGTPATSTQQNPTGIVYNEIGSYDVTLSVTNGDGQTETVTKHNYIKVSEAYNMANGTIETCNALFYDNGGPTGNYSNNTDLTMTFMPGVPGDIIEAIFTEFNTENNYDKLYIYDGSNSAATLIGEYSGSNTPGTVTATNSQGALTFRFNSDYSVNASGWAASIHCVGVTEPLEVEVFADPQIIDEGTTSQLSAYATGGDGNYTYLWEPAETLDNPTIANPVATPIDLETTYKVTVTDGEGETVSAEITVTIRDWAVEEGNLSHLAVYPNPSNGTIHIKGVATLTGYKLLNNVGQIVLQGESNNDILIESKLSSGVYFLQLSNSTGTSTRKIIVE